MEKATERKGTGKKYAARDERKCMFRKASKGTGKYGREGYKNFKVAEDEGKVKEDVESKEVKREGVKK